MMLMMIMCMMMMFTVSYVMFMFPHEVTHYLNKKYLYKMKSYIRKIDIIKSSWWLRCAGLSMVLCQNECLFIHVIICLMCHFRIKEYRSWVVFEGHQPDIYYSWPKAKYQMNSVSESCRKKFSTLYEAIDSFTEYCIFKTQMAIREVQQSAVTQPNTITDEKIDKITDEFTLLCLSSSPVIDQCPGACRYK